MGYLVKEDNTLSDEKLRFKIDKRPRSYSYYLKKYIPAISKYARYLSNNNKENFEDFLQWGSYKLYLLYKDRINLYNFKTMDKYIYRNSLDFLIFASAWVRASIKNYMINRSRIGKGYFLNKTPRLPLNIKAMEDLIIHELDIKDILNKKENRKKKGIFIYYRAGYKIAEIAGFFKVSKQTVSRYIKEIKKEINLYERVL